MKFSHVVLFSLILLAFVPMISAVETLTYQINTNITIRESCHNNGTLCSSSALCNISIFNPKGVNLADNLAMTQNPSLAFFNFTINSTQIDTVGFYRYDIVCSDGGNANFGSFNLQVTGGGVDPSLPQVFTNGMLLFIILFTFSFNVWGFTRLSWSNKIDDEVITVNYMKHVKTILFFTAYMQILFISYIGYSMSQQFIYLDFATSLLRAVFWFLLSTVFPFFVGLWVFTVIFLINDKKMQKAIVRGIPIR